MESLASKLHDLQSQLFATTNESDKLREQLRQKDHLVLDSHTAISSK